MRILNGGNNYHIQGGSDKIFFEHQKILRSRGHKVIPFAPKEEKARDTPWSKYFPSAIDVKNPDYKKVPKFFYNFDAKNKLSQLLKEHPVDIAHLHIYYGRLTTSILHTLKNNDIPIVQTLHDYKLICPNSNLLCNEKICEACQGNHFWKAWTKNCNDNSFLKTSAIAIEAYISNFLGDRKHIDHFIAVSHFLKEKLISYGIDETKISTVHNPMNCENIKPNYQSGDYILYFGRLEKIKGIKFLIEAAQNINCKLYIVGSGKDESFLKQQASEFPKIKFLGFKSGKELSQIIKKSICTVCPSVCYDIFPTTILESFAMGKPVIGSNIGGIPELIDDKKNGFLFEPTNTDELADYLKYVINHPLKVQKMGQYGRQKVTEKFNKDKYHNSIMGIYQKYI